MMGGIVPATVGLKIVRHTGALAQTSSPMSDINRPLSSQAISLDMS